MGQKTLSQKRLAALTITGKDRPGIIANLTGAIYQAGGNLEDASMTILEGEFAMIVIASLSGSGLKQLIVKLNRLSAASDLTISIKQIQRKLKRGERHQPGTSPYLVSVFGKDRAGIVYHVARALAGRGINITDLNSRITGEGAKAGYALILEADFPAAPVRAKSVIGMLQRLARQLHVTIAAAPMNVARL